jgi:NAD(P)-dependent dehydrogenase (short-subunit alcohol dehydrogenase family)
MIGAAGGEAIFIRTDVSRGGDVEALVDGTVAACGRLDYAFNNAGVFTGLVPLSDYTEEMWERNINVNLKGVWLCMKHEIPKMLESGGGAIVNTSSIAGVVGFPQHYGYTASKYGINGITKVASIEFAGSGIRVNAVCPAVTETPMAEGLLRDEYRALHPIGRFCRPEEVAAAAVWLCSDEASYITGQIISVDGGYTVP